jgi:hypothetical protein
LKGIKIHPENGGGILHPLTTDSHIDVSRGLAYPVKVLVAEESDNHDDHERRENELAPRDNEGCREQQ